MKQYHDIISIKNKFNYLHNVIKYVQHHQGIFSCLSKMIVVVLLVILVLTPVITFTYCRFSEDNSRGRLLFAPSVKRRHFLLYPLRSDGDVHDHLHSGSLPDMRARHYEGA